MSEPTMAPAVFITGTDTGIGKTVTTLALMRALQAEGFSVAGMKPVASGAQRIDGRLRNEDALALQAAASRHWPYELINPCVFELPVSPHLAAAEAGQAVDFALAEARLRTLRTSADWVLVEGVGGWLAPLSEARTVADFAIALGLPVVLVVGMRLGCLNHALLTVQSMARSGVRCVGWIANCLDRNMLFLEANIATLTRSIPLPLLGRLPFGEAGDASWQPEHPPAELSRALQGLDS